MVNFLNISNQVKEVALSCGRQPSSIKVVAVSKTVECPSVQQAIDQGANCFGENRPELLFKKAKTFPDAEWHMIGNIQSRKIPEIVASADLIHSVYKEEHLPKINQAAADQNKIQRILIEVNVSGEQSKSGVSPESALSLVHRAISFPHICVCGLMTMAPQGNKGVASDTFYRLASLKEEIFQKLEPEPQKYFKELSMGMSEDWPQAIAQGATIVRIGRAIFSDEFVGA